jgi:lipopolysaccharide/colanic/teichoic acid biosynthesis glycosyltransferase
MSAHAQISDFPGSASDKLGFEARRVFDCLIALIALICIAPLLAMIATAIWVESGGPIFFSQTRLGKGAQRFRLHKFRKFHERGQQDGPAVTLRNDPRMTRMGRLMERTKLDELPQLWNILVGEMAFVGPRPESLAFADCFNGAYNGVLEYRPGIFGPCQAMFRNENLLYGSDCDPEEFYRTNLFPLKARIDLAYFPNRNMISDAGWTVRSVLAVFGWSPLPGDDTRRLEDIESWVQQFIQVTT